jgi:hypothetical protein
MKPWNLYKFQKSQEYNSNVLDYNWSVKIVNDEKTIYVFTQYSTSVLDWIINFLFFYIPQIRRWYVYFACLGWQSAFNSCKQIILNEVLMAMNTFPDYKVVCCGHSYGGAASVLVGIDIFFASGRKPDLITFGAPKPLFFLYTKIVSRLFFDEVRQYAHKCDLISYLPPFIGYWNIKVVRIGKFSLKGLFQPNIYHLCYGDESYYQGIGE